MQSVRICGVGRSEGESGCQGDSSNRASDATAGDIAAHALNKSMLPRFCTFASIY